MKKYIHKKNIPLITVLILEFLIGCTLPETRPTDFSYIPIDTFLVYRRQSLIGEEAYSILQLGDSIVVTTAQGENERKN
jgi:hypothetical protein